MQVEEMNVLVLAYLGDSIYEGYIRETLIKRGISNVKDLQKESLNYVSAVSQAKIIQDLIEDNFFNEEELNLIKRGRNHKNTRHPKSCDAITYRYATAFETLIGYLYLKNNSDRIKEIVNKVFKEV